MLSRNNVDWKRIISALDNAEARKGPARAVIHKQDRAYIRDVARVFLGKAPMVYVKDYQEPPRRPSPPGIAPRKAARKVSRAKK